MKSRFIIISFALIIMLLTETGALCDSDMINPSNDERSGWVDLHFAAAYSDVAWLTEHIDTISNLNARNARGQTAYHLALFCELYEAAEMLLKAGIDTTTWVYTDLTGPYMGQEPPGDTPRMFLPGIVTGQWNAHAPVAFSPDYTEAYWTDMLHGTSAVIRMELIDGRWTYPQRTDMWGDLSFTPDGNRLYFTSFVPADQRTDTTKEEYWYKDKTDTGWSEAKPVSEKINAVKLHWCCSVDKAGNFYFSEFDGNIYCARFIDSNYLDPVPLTELFGNEGFTGRSPYISPDGDYLLFSNEDDLYVTFRRDDGSWTDRLSLGEKINVLNIANASVTPDQKYIFMVNAKGGGYPWGIYWVSASIIDRLRAEQDF